MITEIVVIGGIIGCGIVSRFFIRNISLRHATTSHNAITLHNATTSHNTFIQPYTLHQIAFCDEDGISVFEDGCGDMSDEDLYVMCQIDTFTDMMKTIGVKWIGLKDTLYQQLSPMTYTRINIKI